MDDRAPGRLAVREGDRLSVVVRFHLLIVLFAVVIEARVRGLFVSSTIHRTDYQRVLHKEALRLGAKFRLNSEVTSVDFEAPAVILQSGEGLRGSREMWSSGLTVRALTGRPSSLLADSKPRRSLPRVTNFTALQMEKCSGPHVTLAQP